VPEQLAEEPTAPPRAVAATPRLPVEERPHTRIRPSRGLASLELREAWSYRELLFFLGWRDIKVRYKQTVLGASWAVIQPFVMMVVFSIFLGHLASVPSDGKPYPLFVFSGLVIWAFFSSTLIAVSSSLAGGGALLSKVYFPRLILPVAAAAGPLVDFLLALCLLAGIMGWYRTAPSGAALLLLPAFALLALVAALGVGIWLGALNVRYRDVRTLVPFLVQLWMWITPVAYASSLVPERFRLLAAVNPMSTAVLGARWTLVGTPAPSAGVAAASVAVALVLAAGGLIYFRKVERTFADVL
jgi:lipopolysaccharide transport system permease protein